MSRYKRSFGVQEQNQQAPSGPVCEVCGKYGLCSMPVFVRLDPKEPAHVVCYKAFCVYCGSIQHFKNLPEDSQEEKYAFYMPSFTKRGVFTALRDFFLPRELYHPLGEKADVGLKVRLIRALLKLQIRRPRESEFLINEVYAEYKKDN